MCWSLGGRRPGRCIVFVGRRAPRSGLQPACHQHPQTWLTPVSGPLSLSATPTPTGWGTRLGAQLSPRLTPLSPGLPSEASLSASSKLPSFTHRLCSQSTAGSRSGACVCGGIHPPTLPWFEPSKEALPWRALGQRGSKRGFTPGGGYSAEVWSGDVLLSVGTLEWVMAELGGAASWMPGVEPGRRPLGGVRDPQIAELPLLGH